MSTGRRSSDLDVIVEGGMWQVHLGRSGGKLMTKAELEAAVASDEIGLETLVRPPGAFSWTTAGAATGRSPEPETPIEPERELSSSNAIAIHAEDSDVDLASGDLPMVKDVAKEEDEALSKEEVAAAKPQPFGKPLAILAGLAFLGGVMIVATPARSKNATTVAKPAPTAPATTVAAPATPPTPPATIAKPSAPPQPTPVVQPQPPQPAGEGPLVVFVVPPNSAPTKAEAKAIAQSAPHPAAAKPPAPKHQAAAPVKTASRTNAPAAKKTASLPAVKPAAPSKPVAVTAHAQPARPAAHPITPPRPAPTKPAPAKPTPKVAAKPAAPATAPKKH